MRDILTVRLSGIFSQFVIILFPGITCFTCSNSSSNSVCNRVAVDRACPAGLDTCKTVHYMTGQSSNNSETVHYFTAGVAKMCSTRTDCSRQAGCRMWEGRRVCSTGCQQSYCNEGVPWGEGDVSKEM